MMTTVLMTARNNDNDDNNTNDNNDNNSNDRQLQWPMIETDDDSVLITTRADVKENDTDDDNGQW